MNLSSLTLDDCLSLIYNRELTHLPPCSALVLIVSVQRRTTHYATLAYWSGLHETTIRKVLPLLRAHRVRHPLPSRRSSSHVPPPVPAPQIQGSSLPPHP